MDEITANFILEDDEEIIAAFKIDAPPTKMSELENDVGYVTRAEVDIPDLTDYVTENELENKGYLTEHQDISGKADKKTTYTKDEVDSLIEGVAGGSVDLHLEAPLTFTKQGDGELYTTAGELYTNNTIEENVYLFAPYTSGSITYANFDLSKPWEIQTTLDYTAGLNDATYNIIALKPNGITGTAQLQIYSDGRLRCSCNFNTSTQNFSNAISSGTYIFTISYNGSGTITFKYKSVTANSWTTLYTYSYTLIGEGINYILMKGNSTRGLTMLRENISVVNNGVELFNVNNTEYLTLSYDENRLKVVDGKLTVDLSDILARLAALEG